MKREEQLTNWIKLGHEGQLIKFTAEPYFNHVLAVAKMAAHATAMGYEIGLCHDLFEKTQINRDDFQNILISFGYDLMEVAYILGKVLELTHVFTKKAFPDLSKAVRHARENVRSLTSSAAAQTVKYCDLIYNIQWMMKYDLAHAGKYMEKKKLLLAYMTAGDTSLHQTAADLVLEALLILQIGD